MTYNYDEKKQERMDILKLQGENGEVAFEFLDLINYNKNFYTVLMPIDTDTQEVVILRVTDGQYEDESLYLSLEDENELDEVYEIFKERNKHVLKFED